MSTDARGQAVGKQVEADVCVVGAGFAGLTAARRLAQEGLTVAVVEARDRVGGRVWTRYSQSGVPIDLGGAFVGPDHDRLRALASETAVATHPTFVGGDNILATGGKVRRYRGDTPRINPLALLSAGQALYRLDAMAKKVPVDAPWDAPKALDWDATTTRNWLSAANVPTQTARDFLESFIVALFCCDPSEVSMLDFLFLIRSAGGANALMSIKGGYQEDQFVGGAQSIVNAIAASLGDAVHLSSPVQSVVQGNETVAVTCVGGDLTVVAREVVLSIPPSLVGRIQFDPVLPADHALLRNAMPAGTEIKIVAVYDTPFWRADGVSGASVAMDDDVEITLDSSPPTGEAGVLACFAAGPKARRLALLRPEDRQRVAVDMLARRFGPKAASPVEVLEQNWAEQEWSRGCSMAHFGSGVLTQYGRLLRQPVGRVHWAGTETATTSHGAIDGAVRSGERAASEVLEALSSRARSTVG